MDWNAIGAMGEVIGAAAVVISLIYVAVQVRQNTASSKSTVETEIALALSRVATDAANTGAAAALGRCMAEPEAATEDERRNFFFYATGFFRIFQLAFDQCRAGNLSSDSWESIESQVKLLLQGPGIAQFFAARRTAFKPSFCDYIDSLEVDEASATAFSDAVAFAQRDKQ